MAHRGTSLGWGEFLAMLLFVLTGTFLLLWYAEESRPLWPEARGRVLHANWVSTHYNAPPNEEKVRIVYEYTADGILFRDEWTGMWPTGVGPNPLPEDRLDVLLDPAFTLRVFYDAQDPARNRLHVNTNDLAFAYMLLSGVAALGTVYYLVRVYPRYSALGPRR